MRAQFRWILSAFLALACANLAAGVLLQPVDAPEWEVSEWINEDPGTLAEHKGKVVLIEFFQLWCPVCNSFSIPLFKHWDELYSDRDDVLVVSIHTVFEGHDVQTPERLAAFVEEKGILHAVGIDAYASPNDEVPVTMNRYKTEGTPHVAIVDREGELRFSHFGRFDPATVEFFIERILEEKPAAAGGTVKRTTKKPSGTTARKSPRDRKADRARGRKPPDSPDPLSGKYKLRFEQTTKDCGRTIQPLDVIVDLDVSEDRIAARFVRPFLGLRELEASYDPESGRFEAELDKEARERNAQLDLSLELDGRFVDRSETPRLEYEFALEKRGDQTGWECNIEGKGEGRRIAK